MNHEGRLANENSIYGESQKRLIGSVLAYPHNLDEIISILEPDDFSDPSLAVIYLSIADLTRRNKEVDAFSVSVDLESKGLLESIGGRRTMEALFSAGLDWVTEHPPLGYAALIKDGSVKRRANEIVDESKETFKYDSGVSARESIELLQHSLGETLFSISDETTITKVNEGFNDYLELIEERKRTYEANKDRNNGLQGIPSNIESLNRYTTGWLPGQLITVAARTAIGKALSLDTPLPTPDGWTTMGEVKEGDMVLGMDGKPTMVVAATGIQRNRKCFEVEFSDGSVIIADAEHLWLTETESGEGSGIQKTEEILAAGKRTFVPKTVFSGPREMLTITEIESVPVKCIQVDNEDHMYLAGENMVPTHNTVMAVNSAVAAARANKSVMFFSLEMRADEILDRIYSSISNVPMKELKQGNMSEQSEQWFKESLEEFSELKIAIDTDPEVTIDNIRAKAIKQAQSEEGLDMIIVDYLQLITPIVKGSNRTDEVSKLSRGMKLLAKQLDVPVMVLAQVNKAKDGEDETPRMDQIRESYTIAQDSDVVILLHRDIKSETPDPITYIILDKNRNGESSKAIACRSDLACSKFEEISRLKSDENGFGEFGDDEPIISEEEINASVQDATAMFDDFDDFDTPPSPDYSGDNLDGIDFG